MVICHCADIVSGRNKVSFLGMQKPLRVGCQSVLYLVSMCFQIFDIVSHYGTRMCGCLIVHELLCISCCQWYMASVCSKKLRLISPLSPFFRNASRISQSPTTSTQTFNVNWCRKRSSSTSCGLPSAHILLFWKLLNVCVSTNSLHRQKQPTQRQELKCPNTL